MKATAIAVTASLLAVPALAQTVSQPSIYRGDLHGFNGSAEALPSAIVAIESRGARVMDIRYDGAAGPGYRVVLARGGRVDFDRAARPSGRLTLVSSSSRPVSALDWLQRAEVGLVHKAKVDLATAVRTAEASADGAPAVAAGVAADSAQPTSDVKAYNVLVDRDGFIERVMVDADTGEVVANPDALRVPA